MNKKRKRRGQRQKRKLLKKGRAVKIRRAGGGCKVIMKH